jgi:hypothetical protein
MVASGKFHRVALVKTDLLFLRSVRRLLVAASVVPSSSILVTLMKEALGSSETSTLTRATRRNITEDTILQHFSPFRLVLAGSVENIWTKEGWSDGRMQKSA